MSSRYPVRRREYVCKPISENGLQRFAMLGNQLCREVHRSDDCDLLTEYRANGDLKAVPSAWYAQTRTLRDEWREQRISAEVIPDG
jgi:hypothetical protein